MLGLNRYIIEQNDNNVLRGLCINLHSYFLGLMLNFLFNNYLIWLPSFFRQRFIKMMFLKGAYIPLDRVPDCTNVLD